jgi:plastocyanin
VFRFHFLLFYFSLLLLAGACKPAPERRGVDQPIEQDAGNMIRHFLEKDSMESITFRNDEHYHTIEISQMKFIPDMLHVHKGDTVAWINNDLVTHDVTEETNKLWSSKPMPAGASWEMVFTESATYYCSIHVVMKGIIVAE